MQLGWDLVVVASLECSPAPDQIQNPLKGLYLEQNLLTGQQMKYLQKWLYVMQGGRSWRASGDHQISLTVLAQSACLQIFATKTPYFTIANFCNINVVFFTILPTKFVIFHENRHFHSASS